MTDHTALIGPTPPAEAVEIMVEAIMGQSEQTIAHAVTRNAVRIATEALLRAGWKLEPPCEHQWSKRANEIFWMCGRCGDSCLEPPGGAG